MKKSKFGRWEKSRRAQSLEKLTKLKPVPPKKHAPKKIRGTLTSYIILNITLVFRGNANGRLGGDAATKFSPEQPIFTQNGGDVGKWGILPGNVKLLGTLRARQIVNQTKTAQKFRSLCIGESIFYLAKCYIIFIKRYKYSQ